MSTGLQSPFGSHLPPHTRPLSKAPSATSPSSSTSSPSTTLPSPTTLDPPIILPLSPAVINRIAAGEVIHRPANALKELLENSIDAHSTRISITLRDGGLRQLTLTDNGTGIRRDDLAIVCRRFTTSKIQQYDDLQTVRTFGFRGEALASITHVAHVTITSMTRDSTCAYKAHYSDGELVAARPGESAQPRPCAGVRGTTTVADDLFYNVPIRRQALKSPSDEYSRCLDVVSKYAIHYSGIAFTCKKAVVGGGGGSGGAGGADVNTMVGASVLDNLRALYGPTVTKELVPFECQSTVHHFRMSGYVSNANYHVKRLQLLLFVNGRLVEHTGIKQTLTSLYARYLPKHTHPFCYVSVEVRGEDVDVNVHPTKREVSLLYEDEIMDEMERCVDGVLKAQDSSRVFYTQRLMTDSRGSGAVDGENEWLLRREEKVQETAGTEAVAMDHGEDEGSDGEWVEEGGRASQRSAVDEEKEEPLVSLTQIGREKRVYRPNKLVRTDAKQGKLQSFFSQPTSQSPHTNSPSPPTPARKRTHSSVVATDLSSVHNLLRGLSAASLPALNELFADHTYVGLVNDTYSVIQHKTALYLVHHARLSQHLLYHHTLHLLTTHSTLRLSSPVLLIDMLALHPPSLPPVDPQSVDNLLQFRAMLMDYFGLQLDESGALVGIPELLQHYTPPLLALPLFVHELCTAVDWTDEQRCLHGVARCLANWYCIQPGMYIDTEAEAAVEDKVEVEAKEDSGVAAVVDSGGVEDELPRAVRWCIEHSLFPACRRSFHPPRTWLSDGTLTQLASLENLYKIFERC